MDDLLAAQFDHTTSTPCICVASSSCVDDIFQFDSFSEPLETEVRPNHDMQS